MTLFEEEIWAQPQAVATFIESQTRAAQKIARRLQSTGVSWVLIAARGSSDNAARYGQYVLGIRNRLPVALATPSLFTIYESPPQLREALVIGISQSGQAPDVLAVVQEARRQGCPTLAITAGRRSPLGGAAEHVLELGVGERGVAATMTFTASLAALALLSACWAGSDEGLAELSRVPGAMRETLASAGAFASAPASLWSAAKWVVVGRGYTYGVAFETALKLKEVAGVAVEAYSSADLLHGPVAAVDKETAVVLIAPSGRALQGLLQLVPELKGRGATVVAISDFAPLVDTAEVGFPLPGGVGEWLSPLTSVIPGQVLALRLALRRGLDPDHPAGLDKITRTL